MQAHWKIIFLLFISANIVACSRVSFSPSDKSPQLADKTEIPPGEAPPGETPPGETPPEEEDPVVVPPEEEDPVVIPPEEEDPVVVPPEEEDPVGIPPEEEDPVVVPPEEEDPVVVPPEEEDPVVVPPEEEDPVVVPPPHQGYQEFPVGGSGSDKKLDILFVIDTSVSMRDDLWTLGRRMGLLPSYLNQLNWQIGVTTTAAHSEDDLHGDLVPLELYPGTILTPLSLQPHRILEETLSFSMCNDDDPFGWLRSPCTVGNEKPLEVIHKALQKVTGSNRHFFRPTANLDIVVVSDEDDKVLPGETGLTPSQIVRTHRKLLGPESHLKVYGVIIEPGDRQCLNKQTGSFNDPGASYGWQVSELSQLTGGQTFSLCSQKFQPLFEQIQKDGKSRASLEIELDHPPLAESVQVSVTPQQNFTWELQGQTIRISPAPRSGSTVKVRYEY